MTINELTEAYKYDLDAITETYDRFDDYEAMLLGRTRDAVTKKSASKITDSLIATIAVEGTSRVCATMPTGATRAAVMKDKGYAMVLDIARQRYVIPNANKQHSMLIKLRMWELYKRVHGYSAMMYDWVVRDGYIGPDCSLFNVRNIVPQRGRISENDCDYINADTWVTLPTLEKYLADENGNWDKEELGKLIAWVKAGKPKLEETDEHRKSFAERERSSDQRKASGSVKLTTRYEKGKDGRWITWCPAYADVLRDIPNPHKNGKIPIIFNYGYPLIDTIQALGDFERGKSIQFARDGLNNSFATGFNMSILPPAIVNPNGVIQSTLKYEPNRIWVETLPNSIRPYNVNPQSINTYQAAYGALTGMAYNQAGSTDTRLNQDNSSDPGFGRTPAAVAKQEKRENSRDNWNRAMLEDAIERLYDGMMGLFRTMQKTDIILDLFGEEIELVESAGYKDVKKMMKSNDTKTYGQIGVKANFFEGIDYRFYIDANSTTQEDTEAQRQAINATIEMFNKVPQLQEYLKAQGTFVDIGEAMKRSLMLSGADNIDGIIRARTPADDKREAETMPTNPQMANSDTNAQIGAGTPQVGGAPQMLPPQGMPPQAPPMAGPPMAPPQVDPRVASLAAQVAARFNR